MRYKCENKPLLLCGMSYLFRLMHCLCLVCLIYLSFYGVSVRVCVCDSFEWGVWYVWICHLSTILWVRTYRTTYVWEEWWMMVVEALVPLTTCSHSLNWSTAGFSSNSIHEAPNVNEIESYLPCVTNTNFWGNNNNFPTHYPICEFIANGSDNNAPAIL